MQLVEGMIQETEAEIMPALRATEHEYTRDQVHDSYADVLKASLDNLRTSFAGVAALAEDLAEGFVGDLDSSHRERFYRAMTRTAGVDLSYIAGTEKLEGVLTARVRENVSLIRSIPEEYLKKVEFIVYERTVQRRGATSIIEEIREVYDVTENRARTIARDQTSKLAASLNEERQRNLGVEEYIWVTADDGDRVRETHQRNHGKTFRWDTPPAATGHPGEDINCRCIAQAILPDF